LKQIRGSVEGGRKTISRVGKGLKEGKNGHKENSGSEKQQERKEEKKEATAP